MRLAIMLFIATMVAPVSTMNRTEVPLTDPSAKKCPPRSG
jgi:hypothetical protein